MPAGACMQTDLPIIGNAANPGSEHAHGQLLEAPPLPVYSVGMGPPHVITSFAMFEHSDRSQLSAGEK